MCKLVKWNGKVPQYEYCSEYKHLKNKMDQAETAEEIEHWKERLERLRRLHQPEMFTKTR